MRTSKTLTRLGGIFALIAFFFPWLAFPQADLYFPGFYSYTPFRLMGDAGIVPNQLLAALPLLLIPIGALVLIFTPLKQEPITRGARLALALGNALILLPTLSFFMLAFGQRSYPSAPDIGFWATTFALLLTFSGLVRTLYGSRENTSRFTVLPARETQHDQQEPALSIPSSAQPAQDMLSQDV